MADPDLELPDLSPGETGPQSPPLSATAAQAITSGTPRTAVSTEDKAAIAHLADPYREAPRAQQPKLKNPPDASSTLASAVRNKPAKTTAHEVSPSRDHGNWGEPSDVPPPALHQAPNIFSSIGQWFGNTNFGSATQQLLGRNLKEHTDQWYRAYNEQRAFEQNYHHKQIMDHSQELESNVRDTLLEAKSILEGNPKDVIPRLHELARRTHNSTLEYKINNGGAQAALDYLSQMDRFWQDLNKTNAQIQKGTDETNANQDILNPTVDQPAKRPSVDTPDQPADAGAGGDPFAHQVIVAPLTAPPEAAAPTSQPAPQPAPAAPPETPVAPTAPAGAAAPDAGQGGFIPNINAPAGSMQGAVQPDQPVLVAGGGIEDVPRNWYEKMPQVAQADTPPPPDDWQPPESHAMDNAVLENGQPVPRAAFRQIDDEAANAVMDPRSIQALAKDKNKRVHAGLVERRANEIRDALGMIANNPNRGLGDRPDPRVISDIQKISPSLGRLAATVKAVGDGSIPPPPRNQMYGARAGLGQIIFPLVGKYDPSMLRPGVYEARAAGLKQFGPGGKLGQNALSVVTGAKHSGLYADDIAKWEQWSTAKQVGVGEAASIPGEGNLGLNRLLRMGGQALMSPETQALEGSMDFNRDVVIRELERGYTGAAPHVHGLDQIIADLDWRNNRPEVVKGALARAVALLRERLDENMVMFDQTVGKDPASYMGDYIRSYVSKGQGVLPEGDVVKPEDMGILDKMINDIKSGAAPRPAPSQSIDDIMRKYGG